MARSASATVIPSSLARLLETETRLETLLAESRERAEAMISDAERQAEAGAAALENELAEAAALAETRLSADCAERLVALSRESELALGHLRGIGPERISELARWISEQVLDPTVAGDVP
jgi:hypothetical protein